ncbi:ATPase [Bosea sp. Root483D1]|uniref:chemotaxis protein CheW n=1 Tax=Bosea sp. Root483D1 TaxID=1736544 RepID=UPI00070F46A4|nr:chemotaxis protein CheW [Bosea sp. Root483D1]KRE16095.1 ATPase [Bosea sp. Root483D1]
MDELLQEFLGETGEHLDMVDRELVRFEQEPNNGDILRNIFRLVHTVKGTCGFIGLPRLEALTHAAESVIGQFRDGASVSSTAVTAILETIDRIKEIMAELAEKGQEPPGHDAQLIDELRGLAERAKHELAARQPQASLDPVAAYLARTAETRSTEAGASAVADEMDLVFRAAPSPLDQPGMAHGEASKDARAAGPATLRVNVDTLEHLMTMVSELVLTRNQLLEISRRQEDVGLKAPLQRLSLITAELQDGVMKTRMQPIGNAWSKLPRIVRDLSTDLGKKIELVLEGAETELDRQLLDLIKDPLIHMVRNCADHAIEEPQERAAVGKSEIGTIRVSAYHEGGSVTIAISDDGRGMDVARIRRKAIQRGLASEAEAERMSESQLLRFVLHPGFSTSDTVTAVSGRGVGMDVVKVNVDAIGGMIDIASIAGTGTTITIKIPLTLAIVSALIVATGGQRFAIPQVVVRELVRVKAAGEHRIERINNAPVLRLRERLLPIIALAGVMARSADAPVADDGFIVVTQIGERQFGILVESVFHTEEIVVKPMSTRLRHIPLFSGNTILGDGAVVLIVDPNGVARLVGVAAGQDDVAADEPVDVGSPIERTTMLVFRTGKDAVQAVPLSLVTRLEEVEAGLFENGGGRTLLNYRGRLMPVVPVEGCALRPTGLQPLVIFSEGDFSMALAVDAIVDIVDEVLDIEMLAMPEHGLLGSAIIRGRATEILDLAHYLPKANPNWLHQRRGDVGGPRVLLIEPSEFLREMLAPVLKAAGLQIIHAADPAMAAGLASGSAELSAIVVDLDRDAEAAFALAVRLRTESRHAGLRIIGLTSLPTPELHIAAAQAQFDEVVAKFDRRALIAELAETRPRLRRAA